MYVSITSNIILVTSTKLHMNSFLPVQNYKPLFINSHIAHSCFSQFPKISNFWIWLTLWHFDSPYLSCKLCKLFLYCSNWEAENMLNFLVNFKESHTLVHGFFTAARKPPFLSVDIFIVQIYKLNINWTTSLVPTCFLSMRHLLCIH